MNVLKLVAGLALGLALLAPAPASAQLGTGDLRGKVVDQQGAVLPGVTVIAKNEASGQYRESVSSTDGTFSMIALTPGLYEVTATLTGFKKYSRAGVRVEVGKAFSIEVPLSVGGVEEQVTVTAETPLVDTSSKQIGGVVTSQELNDIPSINRNFTTYLGTLPGVTAFISTDSFGADSIRINGQGTQNVNYTLDGAGNNDTFNGGNGGAQARTPVEAVQEFQLLTSQFDAEFGASSGGVVNAVSKSGTNAFRGVVFYFNANQDMTAQNYFAAKQNLPKADTKQLQWGGNIGGPIIKDKLHFFANLERIDQNRGVTINIPARPELNFSDFTHDNVWNWMLRMDHQINGGNTWAVRYLRETSPQSNQFPGVTTWTKSRAEMETDTDYSVVGTLNSVIKNTRVNSLKLSYTKEDVFFGNPGYFDIGDQAALGPDLFFQTHRDGFSTRANRRMDPAYQFDESFAWFVPGKRGDHDLKFGASVVHTPLHIYDASTLNGQFTFSASDADFNAANPRTYPDRLQVRVPTPSDYVVKGTYYGVFAQDKWKVNNHLTASLGVRWDAEIQPIEEKDNPAFADPNDYPKDLNNFAPRIGLTWALDETGTSVIRGGWGQFYQKTPFAFLTGVVSSGVYSDSFIVNFPANNIDPGPSQGRLPTDPFLVNGPVVNRALLNSMFPAGTLQKNTGTVRFDSPDRTVPFTRQASVGYEKQIGTAMAASVDYIRNDLKDLYLLMDVNPATRASTARTAAVTRPNPNFTAAVTEITNLGWANSNSVQFSLVKRYSRGYQYRVAYTLSDTFGNVASPGGTPDTSPTQVGNDLNLEAAEARTSQDRPHVVSLTGAVEVPKTHGLQLSGSFQYQSGTPFTLTDSNTDPNRNGQFEEPLPAGSYSGAAGNVDAITVENDGGFRGARGPNQMLLSMRGRYSFKLRNNRSLQAWVDLFNVTNRANFNTPSSDRRDAATFLILRAVTNPTRTAQLNLRFSF
ncbi:MAG TPA: carboxypeptidase regulatory-like domain-containing protein [Vicinamibacterales bacterium]|nr:carboxypeptidase regulatory-like domain-containing protein [Vicinamibacterales bacterium]